MNMQWNRTSNPTLQLATHNLKSRWPRRRQQVEDGRWRDILLGASEHGDEGGDWDLGGVGGGPRDLFPQ
jgi:hypothetical protein